MARPRRNRASCGASKDARIAESGSEQPRPIATPNPISSAQARPRRHTDRFIATPFAANSHRNHAPRNAPGGDLLRLRRSSDDIHWTAFDRPYTESELRRATAIRIRVLIAILLAAGTDTAHGRPLERDPTRVPAPRDHRAGRAPRNERVSHNEYAAVHRKAGPIHPAQARRRSATTVWASHSDRPAR